MSKIAICQAAKYIIWPHGKIPSHHNEYYFWCKSQKVPCVWVELFKNHANVRMDYPYSPTMMDETATVEINELLRRTGRKTPYENESINFTLDEIPLGAWEELASGVYFIALRFGKRQPPLGLAA